MFPLLASLYVAQQTYFMVNGKWAKDLSELSIEFPYDDHGGVQYFEGGGYQWAKCQEDDCMIVAKKYRSGVYMLQIVYHMDGLKDGEFLCAADKANNGYGICQALGFQKTSFLDIEIILGGDIGRQRMLYYKQ